MDCTNSPITFNVPKGWNDLIKWIDTKEPLKAEKAVAIFNSFLRAIQHTRVNQAVLRALKRELPITIPSEAYEEYRINSPRIPGALLRISEPVSLAFENGKLGEVDYRRYGGEEQPEEENTILILGPGDGVNYLYRTKSTEISVRISADGAGELRLLFDTEEVIIHVNSKNEYSAVVKLIPKERNYVWISCTQGSVSIDKLYLT